MIHGVELLADLRADEVGLALENARLPKTSRAR